MIGDSCTIGICYRRPKMGTTDKLEYNNTINVILGKENTELISLYSIDFVVDSKFKTYMVVRYESYNYNQSGVTNENIDVSEDDPYQTPCQPMSNFPDSVEIASPTSS